MEYKELQIKEGVKLHTIKTDKFKTNLIAVFLTTKLNRNTVTQNSIISSVLRRGSNTMPSQEIISKKMEEMYGASFDCGLDKTGDNQVLKFYIETINDNFLPKGKEDLLKNSLQKLFDIVFNPLVEERGFKKEYVEQEKNNVRQRIEGKIDNKAKYAIDRCIEEMYKDEPFGLYKFGYIEDLSKINNETLYEQYKELINNCKIDIFVSGLIEEDIKNMVQLDENIEKLQDRKPEYIIPDNKKCEEKEEKKIEETMDVNQGKLVLGLDVMLENQEQKYDTLIYNSILGGSANSKMFQNVREKAHLAYVASSSYLTYKNNIFVNCGIEISNYDKALDLIKKQIEDMRKGEFEEEDIENAKKSIISGVKTIDDEQDTSITYYFGHELTNNKISIEEYIEKIKKISKQDVVEIANKVKINTIYYLKGNES